jgi:hypothetical protein
MLQTPNAKRRSGRNISSPSSEYTAHVSTSSRLGIYSDEVGPACLFVHNRPTGSIAGLTAPRAGPMVNMTRSVVTCSWGRASAAVMMMVMMVVVVSMVTMVWPSGHDLLVVIVFLVGRCLLASEAHLASDMSSNCRPVGMVYWAISWIDEYNL